MGGEQDLIQLTRDTLRQRINQGSGQDLFDLFPGLIIPRGLAQAKLGFVGVMADQAGRKELIAPDRQTGIV